MIHRKDQETRLDVLRGETSWGRINDDESRSSRPQLKRTIEDIE